MGKFGVSMGFHIGIQRPPFAVFITDAFASTANRQQTLQHFNFLQQAFLFRQSLGQGDILVTELLLNPFAGSDVPAGADDFKRTAWLLENFVLISTQYGSPSLFSNSISRVRVTRFPPS